MKVKFALGLQVPAIMNEADVRRFMDIVRRADDYGMHAITTGDSSLLLKDAVVGVTLMALATSRAFVGMRPTNPVTREPHLMAGYLAQIDAMTGGRAMMDMSSGDSAVYNLGRKAGSRGHIEAYIRCIRELLATGESNYRGRPQQVVGAPRKPIRISILAGGPKMLHLGGRIGDAVTAGTGLTPEVVKDTVDRIHAGAMEAGRDPAEVDIWWATRTGLAEDRHEAIEAAMGVVSSIVNHSMRLGIDGKHVPEELRDKVQEYVDGYALTEHAEPAGTNRRRLDALGLTEWAAGRWMLAGNPADWVERVNEIAEAGANQLLVHSLHGLDQQEEFVRLLGEQVMPHFQ